MVRLYIHHFGAQTLGHACSSAVVLHDAEDIISSAETEALPYPRQVR